MELAPMTSEEKSKLLNLMGKLQDKYNVLNGVLGLSKSVALNQHITPQAKKDFILEIMEKVYSNKYDINVLKYAEQLINKLYANREYKDDIIDMFMEPSRMATILSIFNKQPENRRSQLVDELLSAGHYLDKFLYMKENERSY